MIQTGFWHLGTRRQGDLGSVHLPPQPDKYRSLVPTNKRTFVSQTKISFQQTRGRLSPRQRCHSNKQEDVCLQDKDVGSNKQEGVCLPDKEVGSNKQEDICPLDKDVCSNKQEDICLPDKDVGSNKQEEVCLLDKGVSSNK